MSEHHIQLSWNRTSPDFLYDTYDRTHRIRFGGGSVVEASSAPEYLGNSALANPEEMLAAALSSCHMLTFLAVAAKSHLTVDKYEDSAVATLGKNEKGKLTVTKVVLSPKVTFSAAVSAEKLNHLHESAHRNCFIANAVLCDVTIVPI